MVGLSNTVRPMYVTLPGEPMTQGRGNAQCKVNSIAGAYQIYRACQGTFVDFDLISAEGRDLLDDLLWNDGDGSMVLREAAEQYLIDGCLAVREHGYRQPGDCWNVTHHEIVLTIGGPSCRILIDIDDSIRVLYHDAGASEQVLPITDDERLAIAWFAQIVAA